VSLLLPSPSQRRLRGSPLELVVCQVRHEELDATGLKERARRIRSRLKDAYPTLRPGGAVQVRVAATPQGVGVEEQHGWHLVSGDGFWTAVVAGDFFALETSQYLDWDDYLSRFFALAHAVVSESDIAIELRLGLRYVDRLREPEATEPIDWARHIRPAFAGPLATEELGRAVRGLQGLMQLAGDDGMVVNLRYGCVQPEAAATWDFLLDHDCFREGGRDFDLREIESGMQGLHTLALQVFQYAVMPDYFKFLAGETA